MRNQRWRAIDLMGAKPAKTKPGDASVVTPVPINAVITALGPGKGTTLSPAACAACTTRPPGSLTAGEPASDTNATRCPACKRSTIAAAALASLWRCTAMSGVLIPQASSRMRLARVSSAAITSARSNACHPRKVRSPRLPIGVATTYRAWVGHDCASTRCPTRCQASGKSSGKTF